MNNHNISLQRLNTFSVPCTAKHFVTIEQLTDFESLVTEHALALAKEQFYILGDGSNTLFVQDNVNLVIKSKLKGIEITELESAYEVTVAADENWHALVTYCLENNINGLENLALIPGSVGAAPVQNIGAYGVEFADFCSKVYWYDFNLKKESVLQAKQCQFSYRESVFKRQLKNKGMITKVVLQLPKAWQAKVNYPALNALSANASASDIYHKVIEVRQSKLPDPAVLPNAGSFFKNPVVKKHKADELLLLHPTMPVYPQANNLVKLAAGWLIEAVGLKGKQFNKVAVHSEQALVIVNNHCGEGQDVVTLAQTIQMKVKETFNILLEPEVRFVGRDGECNAQTVLNSHE